MILDYDSHNYCYHFFITKFANRDSEPVIQTLTDHG